MAGSSIVRTRPRNHAWDHCGETSAYKTTQRPLLYLCLNEWDVLMWSIRLCNGLGEASPYKVTWLHRLKIARFNNITIIQRSITIASWWARLISPASRLFAEPLVQAQLKENISAPIHGLLWGESTGDRLSVNKCYKFIVTVPQTS